MAPEGRRPVLDVQIDLLTAATERAFDDERDAELASGADRSELGHASAGEPADA